MIVVTGVDHFMAQAVVQTLRELQHAVEELQTPEADNLASAFQNGDTVIHLAQQTDTTKKAVSACLKMGVKRLVHVSSIYGLGYPTPDGMLGDETTAYNWSNNPAALSYQTHQAEQAIWRAAPSLEVVIVNPTLVLGKGCPFYPFYFHAWPGYPAGGITVIDFQAAVTGIVAATLHGRAGERYILGGALVRHKEIFEILAKLGRPSALFRPLSLFQLKCLAYWHKWSRSLFGQPPLLYPEEAEHLNRRLYYSSDKAVNDLQLPPTLIKQTLRETLLWYQEQGYL